MKENLENISAEPLSAEGLGHTPVMLHEVLDVLRPVDGGVYVDGTFGAGGYTRAILEAAACKVYGIDRDPDALVRAQALQAEFPERFFPLEGCFGDMQSLLQRACVARVDGIVLDIGVSSYQIDEADRGFSFMREGPLDMRMSRSGQSARDVVNFAKEEDLADILYTFGEEKMSRKIARQIVLKRAEKPIETTMDLVRVVHSVIPRHGGMRTDPATRTFQALRIYVNDELGELDRALEASEALLLPEGKLVIVTFHSLEDARVKNFLRRKSGRETGVSRHVPMAIEHKTVASFRLIKSSGLEPSEQETRRNPRARSARLRWGIRTAGGAHA